MQRIPSAEERKTYQDILKLYDYAEAIIDSIEQNPEPDAERRLELALPIIEQIEESTEVLAEIYIKFIETGKQPNREAKVKSEKAIRKIFAVIDNYNDAIKKTKWMH